jgi:hypothetical protein
MGTDILTIDGTHSLGFWQVREESLQQADEMPGILTRRHHPTAQAILKEFVSLLRDNPKVWAVYGTEDSSGITIWTYIDSADRNDRALVYEAEWELLNLYPEVGFDFNTAVVPAGHEQFDDGEKVYLYRR